MVGARLGRFVRTGHALRCVALARLHQEALRRRPRQHSEAEPYASVDLWLRDHLRDLLVRRVVEVVILCALVVLVASTATTVHSSGPYDAHQLAMRDLSAAQLFDGTWNASACGGSSSGVVGVVGGGSSCLSQLRSKPAAAPADELGAESDGGAAPTLFYLRVGGHVLLDRRGALTDELPAAQRLLLCGDDAGRCPSEVWDSLLTTAAAAEGQYWAQRQPSVAAYDGSAVAQQQAAHSLMLIGAVVAALVGAAHFLTLVIDHVVADPLLRLIRAQRASEALTDIYKMLVYHPVLCLSRRDRVIREAATMPAGGD